MKGQLKAFLVAVPAAALIGAVTPAVAENAADAVRDTPFSLQQDASHGSTAIAKRAETRGSDLVKLLEPNGPFAQ
jgi:hypothetical protein